MHFTSSRVALKVKKNTFEKKMSPNELKIGVSKSDQNFNGKKFPKGKTRIIGNATIIIKYHRVEYLTLFYGNSNNIIYLKLLKPK